MCGKFRISNQCAIRFDSLGRNAFLLDVSLKAIFAIRAGSQGNTLLSRRIGMAKKLVSPVMQAVGQHIV